MKNALDKAHNDLRESKKVIVSLRKLIEEL